MAQTTQTQSGGLPEVFNYNDKPVRAITLDGEPWFCLSDAGRVLEVSRPSDFLKTPWCHKEGVRKFLTPSASGDQEYIYISEANLYAITMRSRKKEAISFSQWITGEVLPKMRRGEMTLVPQQDPFLVMIETARQTYIAQKELERRTAKVENRLDRIEQERDIAKEALSALPAPTQEPRELSRREQCREAVDTFVIASGLSHHDAWRRIYRDYDYQKATKVTVKARNAKLGKLEWIEKYGDIETLYALILKLTQNARLAS